MTISEITKKMIDYSNGNIHDINHFLKVHAYAKLIGELEGLCARDQFTLETAALIHDIACPLCREKYGNTNGKYQEKEGFLLAENFLKDTGVPADVADRVAYLVAHHHTYTDVHGTDYQILLEADYLVNADESAYSKENIAHTLKTVFSTATGISLLQSIYMNSSGLLPRSRSDGSL